MKKSEIFQRVLDVVSEHTEVCADRIMSTARTNEDVDARCMAIHYWKHYGLETLYIMEKMNRKHHNSILHLYNMYDIRIKSSRYFCIQSEIIGQELAKRLPTAGQ